ncbi:DUF2946 domain-containing protein [Erwinia rhapontici]|uniref:DUF2946 domain-containing protein n=1 Tax=Erwinia rhapontici TaxID=55212 RepID=UPI001D0DA8A4|nr:DUF2946 domain-containing protein [Erwinia rhapontici]MCS3608102.1 hypothetical protein [Erwinia rhapontici]UDQ79694.1 DUF2946 domain-containing protein [Erwinia rhapontici]
MSLISFSAPRNRLAAWLGLLAILLLFIAPVISKSLAQTRGSNSMMMMHHGMAMDMSEMPDMHHDMDATSTSATKQEHHPMSMMDDSACGYCVLLVHLPLDLMTLPLLWSTLQAATQPDVPLFQPVVARFVPRFFHPRAPPLFLTARFK